MSRFITLIALVIMISLLGGCAGSGGSGGTSATSKGLAKVTFRIAWPVATTSSVASPKLLPAAAKSYVISIYDTDPATPVAQQVINFPATTATFTGLPVGTLTVVIKAYAVPVTLPVAGSLVPLASVTQILQTQPGDNNSPPAINLVSTIDHIIVSPPVGLSVSGGSLFLKSGSAPTGPLIATPVDGTPAQNPVTVSTGQIKWSSSNTGAASVDANTGVIMPATLPVGTTVASTIITATDPESHKTGTIGVTVQTLTSPTSSVTFTISNPPPGTKSVIVAVTAAGTATVQQVGPVTWPTPATPATSPGQITVTFAQLNLTASPQTFAVKVTAYGTASGTGTPLGVNATGGTLVVSGATASDSCDMAGNLYSLKVKPASPTNLAQLIQSGPGGVPPGSVVPLEVDLYDKNNVFVTAIDSSNATIKWSPTGAASSVISVSDGVLTAGTTIGGPLTITGQDYVSGKTGTLTGVSVVSNQGSATGTVN
ncbi:MAG TPA: hypothetical protein VGK19_11780 [Capsulimonadaceae bacterium]|jgi:hypothetical protein